jgi:hypothetical protein
MLQFGDLIGEFESFAPDAVSGVFALYFAFGGGADTVE